MRLRLLIVLLGLTLGFGAKWAKKMVEAKRRATPPARVDQSAKDSVPKKPAQ